LFDFIIFFEINFFFSELLIENSDKKGGVPSAPSILLAKSADEELPPDDLLCPICKKIYFDAVITPCCHNSFCDDCKYKSNFISFCSQNLL